MAAKKDDNERIKERIIKRHEMQNAPDRMRRAPRNDLERVFNDYASIEEHGKRYMTSDDFLVKYLGLEIEDEKTLNTLVSAIDSSGDKRISFEEFISFEATLNMPDSMFKVAYEIFDQEGTGRVTLEDVKYIFKDVNFSSPEYPIGEFDWESNFIKLHFGSDYKHSMTYDEFTQFITHLLEEYAVQTFWKVRKMRGGHITPLDFRFIITQIRPISQLPQFVSDHLVALAKNTSTGGNVNYSFFRAFLNLMKSMELVRRIHSSIAYKETSTVTKTEFMFASQRISQLTPMEVEILFALADLHQPGQTLSTLDIDRIAPYEEGNMPYALARQQDVIPQETGFASRAIQRIGESISRFALGILAGMIGTLPVFPIDTVKTKLQYQKNVVASEVASLGEMYYLGWKDCFIKMWKYNPGWHRGFYNGIGAQLVGVGPEKAIKLAVNDLMRDIFRVDGVVWWPYSILSGGMAGGCQVLFTNPLEMVKIRQQLDVNAKGLQILKEMGWGNAYKGASACFLRDIPFSAIYFPTYAFLKTDIFAEEDGFVPFYKILASGYIAGIPAAGLTTPADVIKTRLQAKPVEGREPYKGLFATGARIYSEEGAGALWKGATLRMLRSPIQFSVTLGAYELLQRKSRDYGWTISESKPIGSVHKPPKTIHVADLPPLNPDHVGGFRVGAATFAGIEHKFGLHLPRFKASNVQIRIPVSDLDDDQQPIPLPPSSNSNFSSSTPQISSSSPQEPISDSK